MHDRKSKLRKSSKNMMKCTLIAYTPLLDQCLRGPGSLGIFLLILIKWNNNYSNIINRIEQGKHIF